MTEHFTLEEFTYSPIATERGVSNTPMSVAVLDSLHATMAGTERIRAALQNFPVQILSGFRCLALNRLVGGSENSQHILGEAVDFVCPAFGGPREIVSRLESLIHVIGIDQLILEPSWVHCSFTLNPRYDVFTKVADKYVRGFV